MLAAMATAASLCALVAVPFTADGAAAAPQCFGQPATIVGTPGDDVIRGTAGADVIVARGGDDVIHGLSGNDRICAGPGDDVVRAGVGGDWVSGGPGNDLLGGYWGDDKLFGMAGDDKVLGHDGDDRLDGGPGTDRCHEQAGTGLVNDCEVGDLSVSISGPRRTRTGEATFSVTVTNEGRSAVTYSLELTLSSSNASCEVPAWAGSHAGALLTGDSYRRLDVTASCTWTGKRARIFLDAEVSSHAPDPDPLDNTARGVTNVRRPS
jgi:Ca2+-binding RTX toxin-like protein